MVFYFLGARDAQLLAIPRDLLFGFIAGCI